MTPGSIIAAEGGGAKPKRVHIDREHCIQKHGKLWAAEAIAVPHKFLAFDRGAGYGQWSHLKQRARGAVPGTADTMLRVHDMAANIWAEWKQPGYDATDFQEQFGRDVQALGDRWCCVHSVTEYAEALHGFGVPLNAAWRIRAADHDARAQGEIERAEMKSGRVPKRMMEKRATPGQVAAARRRGFFV